jgi:hypothetical protein
MTRLVDLDLPDLFDAVLDSVATVLGGGGSDPDETVESDLLPDLREHLSVLADAVSDASVADLFDAAGLEDEFDGTDSLAAAIASTDADTLGPLRTLLDLADLGADAPADDDALLERLGEIVGDVEGADADDAADSGTESTDDGDADDLLPTVADVFSGGSSMLADWLDSWSSDDEAEGGDSSAADDDDDELLDTDELVPDTDSDGGGTATGQDGRNTRRRFSSVPSSRSPGGRSGRFSSIKGRTRR